MSVKPFLKWVGGKRQLLPEITALIPSGFTRYIEPFAGGAAVFFSLSDRFSSKSESAWINDINIELVNCYQMVRNHPDELIADLRQHIYDKDYYLALRALDRTEKGLVALTDIQRASRFIYLNKTAFNGLYRVNRKGHFNVPFGRYKNPKIVDSDLIMACSRALLHTRITCMDFKQLLLQTKKGDLVYLDPPYIPLNDTSYFTSYSTNGFDFDDQAVLAGLIAQMDERGVKFIASNAYVPEIAELYQSFTRIEVKAKRAINADKNGRKPVSEVIITNLV